MVVTHYANHSRLHLFRQHFLVDLFSLLIIHLPMLCFYGPLKLEICFKPEDI